MENHWEKFQMLNKERFISVTDGKNSRGIVWNPTSIYDGVLCDN